MNVILETSRLILREFVSDDLDALAPVISDRETMRYYPVSFDRAAVEEWIEHNRRRYQADCFGLWAMVLKSSGELIGDCGLMRQRVDEASGVEIGYTGRRDFWGQGF